MMWTAFVVGLAGSLHCAGMCSPLVMAVTRMSKRAMTTRLVYNAGRIFTYAVMGAVAGAIGGLFDLTPLQKAFSVITGTILVILGVFGTTLKIPLMAPVIGRFTGHLKQLFSVTLKKKTRISTFVLGTLNGFLPCGLTYIALGYTITAPDLVSGFSYMLAFGMGTLPAMIGVPLVANPLLKKLNVNLANVNAAMLIIAGLLLVARNFVHIHAGHPFGLEVHSDLPVCR
ncbi:MAG TPA: sulfite exporter TauE/SafE family protein [Cyclobacteriaceae bacterium]